jgi:hypothetical protein
MFETLPHLILLVSFISSMMLKFEELQKSLLKSLSNSAATCVESHSSIHSSDFFFCVGSRMHIEQDVTVGPWLILGGWVRPPA